MSMSLMIQDETQPFSQDHYSLTTLPVYAWAMWPVLKSLILNIFNITLMPSSVQHSCLWCQSEMEDNRAEQWWGGSSSHTRHLMWHVKLNKDVNGKRTPQCSRGVWNRKIFVHVNGLYLVPRLTGSLVLTYFSERIVTSHGVRSCFLIPNARNNSHISTFSLNLAAMQKAHHSPVSHLYA